MGIFKSKPVAPKVTDRTAILRELIAGRSNEAVQMFVAMTPFVPDFPLRALINATVAGKTEDIATAARFYATTACQNDTEAYGLCMRLAAANAPA